MAVCDRVLTGRSLIFLSDIYRTRVVLGVPLLLLLLRLLRLRVMVVLTTTRVFVDERFVEKGSDRSTMASHVVTHPLFP